MITYGLNLFLHKPPFNLTIEGAIQNKMKFLLSILILFSAHIALAQPPNDYFNEEVKTGQRKTTDQIISSLENGSPESAMQFFHSDISLMDLHQISETVQDIKFKARLSVDIVYEDGFNIYRCTYFNNQGKLFLIDLYFEEGNSASKVQKINTEDEAALRKK